MSTQVEHASSAPGPQDDHRLIRLLEADPELADGAPEDQLAAAVGRTIARVVTLAPGGWSPASLRGVDKATGPFAAIVLNGLVARDVVLADRVATQLIGRGDVITLGEWSDGSPPVRTEWRVAARAELAVLDGRFLAAAQRWPWLTARMPARTISAM